MEYSIIPSRHADVQTQNHPAAEKVIDYIRINHPNIATATVYKVQDSLVSNKLIEKVKTERDVMRYDAVNEPSSFILLRF
jgi:Fur family transcriptional regulator, peroxide stress response regulator